MNLGEMRYSLQSLFHRKIRSWLTILSILIGIAAIFTLVSFGLGIQNYVKEISEEAGTDKLFIQAKSIGAPGTDPNFFITDNDIDFVSKIKDVDEASGFYISVGEIEFRNERDNAFVIGLDLSKEDLVKESLTLDVFKGRFLKEDESKKVLLGYNYQFEDKIFKNAIKAGDKIEINGHSLEVVGFLEEAGNPSDDSNIYLGYSAIEELFPKVKDKFGYAIIRANKNVNTKILAERIHEKLRKHKGQEEGKEDFYVQTFEDLLETFGTILAVINGVLVLIALVSLLVAVVNITNTMYTAVLERTNEIGVMKAIGAQRSNIIFIFIFESGLLGMIGGIIGVIIGYIISKSAGAFAASAGFASLQPIFPIYLIVGSILLAFLVGTVGGTLPAIKASKLNPVDALRYE